MMNYNVMFLPGDIVNIYSCFRFFVVLYTYNSVLVYNVDFKCFISLCRCPICTTEPNTYLYNLYFKCLFIFSTMLLYQEVGFDGQTTDETANFQSKACTNGSILNTTAIH